VELLYFYKRQHIPVHEVAVTWLEIPGLEVKLVGIAHDMILLMFYAKYCGKKFVLKGHAHI